MTTTTANGPVSGQQRFAVLDALRGFALMGIALANFPEFGLWTFLSGDSQAEMSSYGIDQVVRFLQYLFVDGKFYTIFSILFGIGFAIILSRKSVGLFYRRMSVLLVIGLLHLLFIWSGDILLLYAIGGLLLPLFLRLSDKTLLCVALFLLLLPIVLDCYQECAGVDFSAPLYDAWWRQAHASGITDENFATWLRDADNYPAVFEFLKQGAIERMWEFVGGHRLPKVLGLFILGYLAGRNRLYARIDELRPQMVQGLRWLLAVGLPASLVYAWSAVGGQPWGITVHSLLYTMSVAPLGLAYTLAICLWQKPFLWLRHAGRMALTCYIGQSIFGIIIFYGIGFGLGTSFGLIHIELAALAVFFLEVITCRCWLNYFRFGPLEWIWRIITYGRWMKMRNEK